MDVTLATIEGSKKVQDIKLRSEETIVGRRDGCDLRIPSSAVSRRHCRLSFRDDLLTVEDLASANGTFLNNKRITQPEVVRPGDRLEIGPVTFLVQYPLTPAAEAKLAELPAAVETVPHLEVALADQEEEAMEGVLVEEEEETVQAAVEEETGNDFDFSGAPKSQPDASEVMQNWQLPAGGDLRDLLEKLGDGKKE